MGTVIFEEGTDWIGKKSEPWGLPLKARGPLGMTGLTRVTEDGAAGVKKTVLNYLGSMGMGHMCDIQSPAGCAFPGTPQGGGGGPSLYFQVRKAVCRDVHPEGTVRPRHGSAVICGLVQLSAPPPGPSCALSTLYQISAL